MNWSKHSRKLLLKLLHEHVNKLASARHILKHNLWITNARKRNRDFYYEKYNQLINIISTNIISTRYMSNEYLYLAEPAEPGCHDDRTRLLSSATKMASSSELLTVDNIWKIWKTEFLPNIKKEIRNELKTEIEKVNCLITNLSKRLNSGESSQQLISDKYDSVLKSMQSTKKQINDLNNWCEAQDNKINHLNGSVYHAKQP